MVTYPSYTPIIIVISRWAHLARPPAACDLDIFHYTDNCLHMHAIEELIVNRAVWKGKLVEVIV